MIRFRTMGACLAALLLLSSCTPNADGIASSPGVAARATAKPSVAGDDVPTAMPSGANATDATGSTNTPKPTADASPSVASPARFASDENAIAGLTVGVSTAEDVIAIFGEASNDYIEFSEYYGTKCRQLRYEGMSFPCVQDAQGVFRLYNVSIDNDIIGPRGIHIGLTTEQVETLFPREETTKVRRTSYGAVIEYLYLEGTTKDENDDFYRNVPPYGLKRYLLTDPGQIEYTFLSAFDKVFLDASKDGKPGARFQISCNDGVVIGFSLGVWPVVDADWKASGSVENASPTQ